MTTLCECGAPATTKCGHDEWIAVCGAPTCGAHGTGGQYPDAKLCPRHGSPTSWATEAGGVLVSTRFRESSALVNNPPWYFETFGFRDERIVWESTANTRAEAEHQHDLAARYYGSRP